MLHTQWTIVLIHTCMQDTAVICVMLQCSLHESASHTAVVEEAILHWSGIIWKIFGQQCGKQNCHKNLGKLVHTSPR